MMKKTTKLMPLMRHKRSQNALVVYTLVDAVMVVVDALMRISSHAVDRSGECAGSVPSRSISPGRTHRRPHDVLRLGSLSVTVSSPEFHLARTTSGFPFSTMYVTSSLALPLPTF